VSVDRAVHAEPVTGRLVLVLSRREIPEPRFQIAPNAVPLFAVDVSRLMAGQEAMLGPDAIGHPVDRPAAPAPSTDAERVYVYFGSYGLLSYDFERKL
jgi:hypothetical protein